jgi:hypothetical protein
MCGGEQSIFSIRKSYGALQMFQVRGHDEVKHKRDIIGDFRTTIFAFTSFSQKIRHTVRRHLQLLLLSEAG